MSFVCLIKMLGVESLRSILWLQNVLLNQLKMKNLPTDSSGQYKIRANFLVSKDGSERGRHDLTLVTHCTSNHLHYLLDLTVHWKGPISLGMDRQAVHRIPLTDSP